MIALLWLHIAAGLIALVAGAAAVAARKGGRLHGQAGTLFAVSMFALGVTAAILEPFRTPPGSPIVGLFVCYFVATSWVAARRRDGSTGRFELLAGAVALGTGALMILGALSGSSTTPVGAGPVIALAVLCLLAGLGDLGAFLRRRLTPAQRISRHLWRMCFAFFIATGSFFLGQQDAMPAAVRGSPLLFVLAFAPFAVLAYGLARVRFSRMLDRLALTPRGDSATSPGESLRRNGALARPLAVKNRTDGGSPDGTHTPSPNVCSSSLAPRSHR